MLLGRRNTKRRPPSWPGSLTAIRNIRDSAPSGLRGFLLGKRYSLGSSKGEPGFERIQDQEQNREYYPYGNGGFGAGKEEYEEDEKEKGAREIDLLPEVCSRKSFILDSAHYCFTRSSMQARLVPSRFRNL